MIDDHKENNEVLTDAEAELYDRQLRLWGSEAQSRLRASKVLLIGLNGLGAEAAKNVILSGIKSITFLDHRNSSEVDRFSQFLIADYNGKNRAEESVQRAQALNPMVNVTADTDNIDNKPDEYFGQFDIVCATQCNITQLKRINQACRKQNVKFFATDIWGLGFGYVFVDLQKQEYIVDVSIVKKAKPESGEPMKKEKFETITINEKRTDTFVPFESILNVSKSMLRENEVVYYIMQIMLNYREKYGDDPKIENCEKLSNEVFAIVEKYQLQEDHYIVQCKDNDFISFKASVPLSPGCSILGGILAQEVIKAASQKHAPVNNLFTFNPCTFEGRILTLNQ